jgi:hypothetical protein
LAASLAVSILVTGCVAALAIGAAGGAGGYAWASGKLSFTTPHGINECHDATLAALSDLKIKLISDQTDRLAGKIKGQTATGESVAVDLEPQAPNITKIDVRVGFWGNKTQSTMIADGIKRHLH